MNREHLLRAAADFLSRRPNATQDEIAVAVGVSRATLHRHFAGREALLEALDRLAITQLREALDASRWHEGEPTDALRRLVQACEPVASYVALLYARNEAAQYRQSRAGWDEISTEIEEFFLRGQQAGVFRPDVTAVWLTEAFYSLVSGAGWSIKLGRAASRDFTTMITELLLHGAKAPTRGNLPAPLAGFVGREAELAELEELISHSRLVTLTGIGGIGKSTLALQAARQRIADFRGGVWLIELGELSDPELLAAVAAAALGIRDQTTRPLVEVMVEALADREALLVLDNCEHVLDATGRFVQRLLAGCPRLRVLATSREILDIDEESVLPVPPLPVPDIDHLPDYQQLARCDAVTLFLKHARATQRSFHLTERNALPVARICTQLDGLPLALELAAPLLRTMAVEQISARISNRFKLLAHGKRGAPTRQQTLNYCISWSYERCNETERKLWARLSVFTGSFEPAAVQHICAPDMSEDKLLETLCTLEDKSILLRTSADDALRFRQLATLREYGHHQLSTDEHTELRHRHLDWYHQLAQQAGQEWYSERQLDWFHRLHWEIPNLREALQFAYTDAPPVALQMATSLYRPWTGLGKLQQGRRRIEKALDASPTAPAGLRLQAVIGVAELAFLQADIPAITALQNEARALLARVPTDSNTVSHFTTNEAALALLTGQLKLARSLAQESFALTDVFCLQIYALLVMTWSAAATGDAQAAVGHAEHGLALSEARGHDIVLRTYLLAALALGRMVLGQLALAEEAVREGLQLSRLIADTIACATFVETAAWIAAARNEARRAAVLTAAAAAISRSAGADSNVSANVGQFHEACGLRIREQLSPGDYRTATNEGRFLSLDEATAIVLDESM
ncbi:NB-ARC domain-containing protein [Mycobacterium sp. TY815]|uniref:NB-ARC domain-containing protein n=1 Tax=Mycobacterium sp. TY815 TaxID=3050581 RepID=UPI0027404F86|nr:NB-ARC domain-containing protein [Mycobacterium sp. TY815]MDP7706892.1 TetR family transcriptional regulator [Mycobacterium sp. TY815]